MTNYYMTTMGLQELRKAYGYLVYKRASKKASPRDIIDMKLIKQAIKAKENIEWEVYDG